MDKDNIYLRKEKRKRAISRRLKPCPLCGGPAYYDEVTFNGKLIARRIICYECRLLVGDNVQKRLIEKWNRRATNAEQQ